MSKVSLEITMSLDGFVAGQNDSPQNPLGDGGERLFAWYNSGDTPLPLPGTDMVFQVSRASANLLQQEWDAIGAAVMGRRMFDISGAWGGNPPGGGSSFIVTHNPPAEWLHDGSPFIFVTDGVESAVAQARQAAGEKNISIGSASIAKQCLQAGLLDEILIHLVPVLMGGGVSLFPDLPTPADMEILRVVEGQGVTHLHYRVIR